MSRLLRWFPLFLVTVLASCGDDAGTSPDAPGSHSDARIDGSTIDAAAADAADVDAGDQIDSGSSIDASASACGPVTTTLSTFPATYDGATIGSGNDVQSAGGDCASEIGWYGSAGEDQTIQLTGLTGGATYVVQVNTDQDLSFYVTTACDAGAPASLPTGACLLHVDNTLTNEAGQFTAPNDGNAVIIVDAPNDPSAPPTGTYSLWVGEPECQSTPDCSNPGEPVCIDFTCVECDDQFDCDNTGSPYCSSISHSCVAAPAQCTGDDANEPDDSPAIAQPLALPTAGVPTVKTGNICDVPRDERDWFVVTAGSATAVDVSLSWASGAVDLDFFVYDPAGTQLFAGAGSGNPEELSLTLPVGTSYIAVDHYEPLSATTAGAYTLTVSLGN